MLLSCPLLVLIPFYRHRYEGEYGDRPVAIKYLKIAVMESDPASLAEFEREVCARKIEGKELTRKIGFVYANTTKSKHCVFLWSGTNGRRIALHRDGVYADGRT